MRPFQHIASILFLILLLFNTAPLAEGKAAGAVPAPPDSASIPDALKSPRATIETFLNAMEAVKGGSEDRIEEAISTLDLSEINQLVRTEKGRDIAWTLLEVLNRTRSPDTRKFSTRTEGKPYVFQSYPQGRVAIHFTENQGWRFDQKTVAALPSILDGLSTKESVDSAAPQQQTYLPLSMRIRQALPAGLKAKGFVLEHWQWLGILLIVAVGIMLDKLVSALLQLSVRSWRRRYAKGAFREISDSILRPFGLMAMAATWWTGLNILGLPDDVLLVLLVSVKFLASISGVWGAYRLVDLLDAYLSDRALATENKLDDALVPMVKKIFKVFVTILGLVFIADNLNISVSSLLAGLGLRSEEHTSELQSH